MTSDKRLEALIKLAEEHGISPRDQNTAGEDLAEQLASPKEIRRWAAVTRSEATRVTYVKTYASRQWAQNEAASYIADGIWPEVPVEVVDLDTGASSEPTISVEWPGEEAVVVKGMTEICAGEEAALALEQIAELGATPFPEYPEGEVPPEDLEARLAEMTAIAKAKRPKE